MRQTIVIWGLSNEGIFHEQLDLLDVKSHSEIRSMLCDNVAEMVTVVGHACLETDKGSCRPQGW